MQGWEVGIELNYFSHRVHLNLLGNPERQCSLIYKAKRQLKRATDVWIFKASAHHVLPASNGFNVFHNTIFRLELMFKYVIKEYFWVNIVFLHYDEHTTEIYIICSLLCNI